MQELIDKIQIELEDLYKKQIKPFLQKKFKDDTFLEKVEEIIRDDEDDEIDMYLPYSFKVLVFCNSEYKIDIYPRLEEPYEERDYYQFEIVFTIKRIKENLINYVNSAKISYKTSKLQDIEKNYVKILRDLWSDLKKDIEDCYSDQLKWNLGLVGGMFIVLPMKITYIHANLNFFKNLLRVKTWEDKVYLLTRIPLVLIVEHEKDESNFIYFSLGVNIPGSNWIFMPKFFKNTQRDLGELEEFIKFLENRDFDVSINRIQFNYKNFSKIITKYNEKADLIDDLSIKINLKIDEIEKYLYNLIKNTLKEKFKNENEWWVEGIPLNIRKKLSILYEERKCIGHPFDYTTIIHLKEIFKANWGIFQTKFPLLKSNRKIFLEKIQEFNELRNKMKHPIRDYKTSNRDLIFLNDLIKKFGINDKKS